MADDKDIYDTFCDILHEIPELETPLRQYRQAQAKKAVQEAVRRKRAAELEDAWQALLAMRRPAQTH